MESALPHSRGVRMLYFWVGIGSTFLYRVIIVLNNIDSRWADLAWYVGTLGFLVYFGHRFQVSRKRARIIQQYQLEHKIATASGLDDRDKAAMEYIFVTLRSSKEKWNYIFIFVMSGLALIVGAVLDLM